MMRGGGLGLGLLGGFLMLLLFIAIAVLVIWLVVKLARSTPGTPMPSAPQPQVQQPDPVLATLRRRLAEGAITPQEFDELRQKLGV